MSYTAYISSDYHTHTTYSHGKGSILDNVRAADKKKLKTIGISDHGPGHYLYGIDLSRISHMRRDIAGARAAFPDMEILLGVEANICNISGNLDLTQAQQKLFDYVMAGYHFGTFGEKPVRSLGVMLGGHFYNLTGRSTVRAVNHNTDMVVNSLFANRIKILTHPGDKICVDMDAVAQACEKTGTLMEINNRHNGLSRESLRIAAKYDVQFIIGSDAHRPEDVGCCGGAADRIEGVSVLDRIVNYYCE